MPAPSLASNLVAIVGVPLVMWLLALGLGLAAERVVGLRLGNAFLLALGICTAIALLYPIYALHGSDVPAIVAVLVVGLAGLALARDGLRARVSPGRPGWAAVAIYVLFMLPVIARGHWTWVGYNFDNDTAVQFQLADHLKVSGTALAHLGPGTPSAVLSSYLNSGYPLGAHALLATLSGLLRTPVNVLYQGYLASFAALLGLAVAATSERVVGRRGAVGVGVGAGGANLLYQYAMAGTIKEIAVAFAVVASAALFGEAVRAREPIRGAVLAGIPLAALMSCYHSAGAPYVLALGGAGVVWLLVAERRLPRPRWVLPGALCTAVTALLCIPALTQVARSFAVTQAVVNGGHPTGNSLGILARPLPLSQVSGVWLDGDFRLPIVSHPNIELTIAATVVILIALLPGLALAARAREPAMPVALLGTGLVMIVLLPRVTPYGAGKVLAIASPVCVWGAGVGLVALGRLAAGRRRSLAVVPWALGGLAALAVVASDVLAVHHDQIAPTARFLAMQQIADRFPSQGPVLVNESDEYIKFFARRADVIAPFESITPLQAQLRAPNDIFNQFFDLDDETLAYVERFPIIVQRRSPIASRPPANYVPVWSNAYYQAWQRVAGPQVLDHLPLQGIYNGSAVPSCRAVLGMARRAPASARLVAAVPQPQVGYSILTARTRPFGWGLYTSPPGSTIPHTPGYVREPVAVPAGATYIAWVQGSFSRPVYVKLDGRTVGSVGGLDSVGQWSAAGAVTLAGGRHLLGLYRGGGRPDPGDGSFGEIGWVTLQRVGPETLRTVALSAARTLCGSPADWVEVVR